MGADADAAAGGAGTAVRRPTARLAGAMVAAIEHSETATVITVAGTLDADPVTRLLDDLAAQHIHGDVIIDLTRVMMTSPPAIRSLVARLTAWTDTTTTTLRIVCDRLTARRMLRRWGAADLPLDASMANALDALSQHALHRHGGVGTASPNPSR